jgi:hypothetical protein
LLSRAAIPSLLEVSSAILAARLLDLRFLELDVLACDGIVFFENKLLGRCARILLRDVEEPGSG